MRRDLQLDPPQFVDPRGAVGAHEAGQVGAGVGLSIDGARLAGAKGAAGAAGFDTGAAVGAITDEGAEKLRALAYLADKSIAAQEAINWAELLIPLGGGVLLELVTRKWRRRRGLP